MLLLSRLLLAKAGSQKMLYAKLWTTDEEAGQVMMQGKMCLMYLYSLCASIYADFQSRYCLVVAQ